MIGLLYIAALAVYLLITLGVVIGVVIWAGRRGRSRVGWGLSALLGMYLLVFWDHIPTLILHKHYCDTEAGFWVYKTPEQWEKENRGALPALDGRDINIQKGEDEYSEVRQLNQRIKWVKKHRWIFNILQVARKEEVLVDTKTSEVLAKSVEFTSGSQRSTGAAKFWLVRTDCGEAESYSVRLERLVNEIYDYTKREKK